MARDPQWLPRLHEVPIAWWEGLAGAPLLQAVLDAEGVDEAMPEEALGELRALEARNSRWDAGTAETALLDLEQAFVDREIQALGRQIQDPATLADPNLQRQLESRLAELLPRLSIIKKQQRSRRFASL
jgi:DNA primase